MPDSESTPEAITQPSGATDSDGRPPHSSQPSPRKGSIKWPYVARRALAEFNRDQCTDLAASLTYFAVLSAFPGLLAVISLLAMFGQGQESTQAIIGFAHQIVPADTMKIVQPAIEQLTTKGGGVVALIIGVGGALWSASGYVGAFGRAMNRIYDVNEGRVVFILKPVQLLVTLTMVIAVVLVLAMSILSGGIAEKIGNLIGLGDTSVSIWNIAKWPVIAIIAILMIALLYYATPNVRQPKFRWLSPGAAIALIVMAVASFGFAFYVNNFGKFGATYGLVGGVIVLLLWLWIMNNVMLFGAEIDVEITRARQLARGLDAEEDIRLPLRSDTMVEKQQEKQEKLVDEARDIRLEHLHRVDREGAPGQDTP
ncbi:YihY/virulence factor BrkB family protein [Devriesea agamarum]|uniref:YihY/virulence factor BrkB family protein n=1 Tax=Devriesea agamarum TaxID=472569 RepID=UPI00071CA831|nr:YihY/virulence factor BrkB family protein [Devriesea agamarum]